MNAGMMGRSGDSRPMTILHGERMGARWGKCGKSHAIPPQCPCFMGKGWEKDGGSQRYHTKNWTEKDSAQFSY